MVRMINHGYPPNIYLSAKPRRRINAYVADCLKADVVAEVLARNLPIFSRFLDMAALSDTEMEGIEVLPAPCSSACCGLEMFFCR